jgi:hypothetical protein
LNLRDLFPSSEQSIPFAVLVVPRLAHLLDATPVLSLYVDTNEGEEAEDEGVVVVLALRVDAISGLIHVQEIPVASSAPAVVTISAASADMSEGDAMKKQKGNDMSAISLSSPSPLSAPPRSPPPSQRRHPRRLLCVLECDPAQVLKELAVALPEVVEAFETYKWADPADPCLQTRSYY